MKYIITENECTGCGACYNICPEKCIKMVENKLGEIVPEINNKYCIHCNLCKQVCPQNELLKTEFPNLSFEEDADIERYYQLRKDGYQREALNIYNTALKRKFPDDATRIKLLHFYRSRDPGFPVLLRQCLISMADLFIERLTKPIKDLFGAVFFISVGMLIQPNMLVEYIWPIIIISIVTMFGQMIFSTLGMLFSGQSLRTAMRGGFSMVQIGEFSFIVASLGMSLGVISDFLYPIVVCVSVITSFLTPVFIRNAERAYGVVDKLLPQGAKVFLKRNTSERQMTDDKDDDWKRYLKRIGTRTFICSTAMFVIYLLSVNYMLPFFQKYSTADGALYITAGISVVVMIPFVALMHGTNKVLYTKLWMKHKANKLPLLTLQFMRVLIASAFIALTLNRLLDWPFLLVMIIAIIPASFIVRSEYIRGKTKRIEMSFVANFYEKT